MITQSAIRDWSVPGFLANQATYWTASWQVGRPRSSFSRTHWRWDPPEWENLKKIKQQPNFFFVAFTYFDWHDFIDKIWGLLFSKDTHYLLVLVPKKWPLSLSLKHAKSILQLTHTACWIYCSHSASCVAKVAKVCTLLLGHLSLGQARKMASEASLDILVFQTLLKLAWSLITLDQVLVVKVFLTSFCQSKKESLTQSLTFLWSVHVGLEWGLVGLHL